jgi:hypothetical protein
MSRVSDPHWFNADPDPAFFDCGSGILMTKNWKKFKGGKTFIFFDQN